MTYHITITNNETNEILANDDTNCIIGAYAVEDGTYAIGHTACNGITLLSAVAAAEKTIHKIKEDSPELEMLLKLHELFESKNPEFDESDDTDN